MPERRSGRAQSARGGRSPNRARPRRSMVEPSESATSRSSDIPIDRTGRSSESASDESRREPGAGGLGRSRWSDRHQPGHVEVLVTESFHQFGDPVGRAPAPPGKAGHVQLDQDRRSGAPTGDGVSLLEPADPLPPGHQGGQAGHLVPLHGPQVVPHRGGGDRCSPGVGPRCRHGRAGAGAEDGGLAHQLVGVVLPDVGQPGVEGPSDRLGPEPLGHRHDPDRGGIGRRRIDPSTHLGEPGRVPLRTRGGRGRAHR